MQDNDDDQRQRQNLAVAAIAVLLVIGSVWLLLKYRDYRAESDCFLSGRHNCAPVDMSNQ